MWWTNQKCTIKCNHHTKHKTFPGAKHRFVVSSLAKQNIFIVCGTCRFSSFIILKFIHCCLVCEAGVHYLCTPGYLKNQGAVSPCQGQLCLAQNKHWMMQVLDFLVPCCATVGWKRPGVKKDKRASKEAFMSPRTLKQNKRVPSASRVCD